MIRVIKYLALVSVLLIATTGHAQLFRVGPQDVSTAVGPGQHGYPQWYQDTLGLALDLCVPKSFGQLGACLATPAPGDPIPTLPYAFPVNWPDEFFWFGADALIDFGNGNSAILVQAVEAAFGGGPAAVGDEIAFARIRIRFVAPVAGNYAVTFPYGTKTFPNIAQGEQVFFTSDIGIGAPGDFTGALGGAIGPFLRAAANGVAKPFHQIDGDLFLADPAIETQVIGSPTGNNIFQVCVDTDFAPNDPGIVIGCLSTDLFTLIGKVHTVPIASSLDVARATYSRLNGNTFIDVFASAEGLPGSVADLTVGIDGAPSALMSGPQEPGGQFYSQSIIANLLPSTVTVINSADTPASSVVKDLVDLVTITQASYDASTGELRVMAESSDMDSPPSLHAIGIPGSITGSEDLLGGLLSFTLPNPLPAVPPKTVTVVSDKGGSATVNLRMLASITNPGFPTGAPLAVNDTFSIAENTNAILFILTNDGQEAIGGTITLVTQPANGGSASINFDGISVDYTPGLDYFGQDSFIYTVTENTSGFGRSSNMATVTINVTQFNDPPIANADTVAGGVGVTINVTANDSDPDGLAPEPGGLDPATVVIGNISTGISSLVNNGGIVTFSSDGIICSVPGACWFTYTVSDTGTPPLSSNPATVTITAGNEVPIAIEDNAAVNVEQAITIDVAANDFDPDGTVIPSTVTILIQPAQGTLTNNFDGTLNYQASATPGGPYAASYTIADNMGAVSSPGILNITVNPAADTLALSRAQCKGGKDEWKVEGTSSVKQFHTVDVYRGATVAGGTLIATNVQVDNFGDWKWSSKNEGVTCNNTNVMSFESSLGGKLEGQLIFGN